MKEIIFPKGIAWRRDHGPLRPVMLPVSLSPSNEWHTNGELGGFGDVPGLPVTKFKDEEGMAMVVSTWRVGFWDRIRFLISGKVQVQLWGQTHAPISVIFGNYFHKTTGDDAQKESNAKV
jgi:hypothetical protein